MMILMRVTIGVILAAAPLGLLVGLAMAQDPDATVLSEEERLNQQVEERIKAREQQAEKTDWGLVPGEAAPHAGQSPHGEAADHGAAGANPLEFRKDLALWTGVIFVVLLLVLWRFAWGPIMDGLAKREGGIANQISEAEAANRDAKQLLAQYQQKLDATGEDVRQMLEQARRDAEQSGRVIVDAARDEAKAEHRRALAEIDQATAGALAELAQRSAELAVGLAGKIVKAELRPDDHTEMVQQAVTAFTKTSNN